MSQRPYINGKLNPEIEFTKHQKKEIRKEIKRTKMIGAVTYSLLSEWSRLGRETEEEQKNTKNKREKRILDFMYLTAVSNTFRYNSELSAIQNLLGYSNPDKFIKECISILDKEAGNIWETVIKKK